MRVLFLTQIIPYPPDAGPKVKTWNVLKHLSERGHEVVLASFARPEEDAFIADVEEICAAVHTIRIKRSWIRDIYYWIRCQFTGKPFLIERDNLSEMRKLVERLLHEESFDVFHADQLSMTQFFAPRIWVKPSVTALLPTGSTNPSERHGSLSKVQGRPSSIFDAHNAVWMIVDRMRTTTPRVLHPLLKQEQRKIKRFEGEMVRTFDHTLAVSELDRIALIEAAVYECNRSVTVDLGVQKSIEARVTEIPIAVDTSSLRPIDRAPSSTNILTLGTLHYPPNADGIRWFVQEVFPLILQVQPEAKLTIIGKNPPKDFLQFEESFPNRVLVTGYVRILDPYLEQAALMVVPVRVGGGMRVRILEAFARGIPVVTTTIGLEGIEACVGEDVFVADTPKGFANSVIDLLQNPNLQARLATGGRRLVESRYDRQTSLSRLDEVYSAIKV